jgi:hypothetical protein
MYYGSQNKIRHQRQCRLVNENKAVRMFVTGLVVTFTEPDSHDVKYDLNYSLCEIPENKLFKTKEELLEFL